MKNKNKAFTLIELLVVIVIIGILATVSVATFGGNKEKAELARNTADCVQEDKCIQARTVCEENGGTNCDSFCEGDTFNCDRSLYAGGGGGSAEATPGWEYNSLIWSATAPTDLNWSDAIAHCTAESSRLPIRTEIEDALVAEFDNGEELGFSSYTYYWTGTEFNTNNAWHGYMEVDPVWGTYLDSGTEPKTNAIKVRCVRPI